LFNAEKWETYIDKAIPGARKICEMDKQECIEAGFSWEKDFLPVLNEVYADEEGRNKAIRSFHIVTDHLNERIIEKFGRTVDTNLALYLGLCNGAGWVTRLNNESTVLLGIEKIIELKWYDVDSMNGLIIHEMGHVYQDQYGVLHRQFEALQDQFLWQLFTEGIAMVFEQEVVGDSAYFHQYDNNWREWCHEHINHIKQSFYNDLPTMTNENQRYFGDWVSFEDHGDTGYYLGADFVRFVLETSSFDDAVNFDIDLVKRHFERYMRI
jgi:hypothetical protein